MSSSSPSSSSTMSSHACKRCSERKVKCTKEKPKCAQCVRFGVECVPVIPPDETRKRKSRFPEATLISKIRRYEGRLRRMGVDPDSIAESEEGEGDEDYTSAVATSAQPLPPGNSNGSGATAIQAKAEREFVEEILQPPTRVVGGRGAIFDFFDRLYPEDGMSRLFASPAAWEGLPEHPSAFEIWSLWQVFMDSVDPVIKILHTPTVHRKLLAAGSKLIDSPHQVEPCDHLLFFAIHRIAVTASLEAPNTSTACSNESLEAGFRYWLARADGWRSTDPRVVQALTLYANAIFRCLDPRALGLVMGVVVRSACRMHFHVETGGESIEAEMHRRTWWEITTLDGRSQEIAGLDPVLLARNVQRRVPNALSDDVLAEGAHPREPYSQPQASASLDALFPYMRALFADFAQRCRAEQARQGGLTAMGMFELSTPIWTLTEKLHRIDVLEARLEAQVFRHCGSDSLSRLIVGFGSSLLAKARMLAILGEESLQARRTVRRETHKLEDLRQRMLELSVRCISYYSELLRDSAVRARFGWFIVRHVPAIPMIHLFRLLQTHTTGPSVDAAWALLHRTEGMGRTRKQFDAHYKGQGFHWLPTPEEPVLGDSTFLKAWEARKAAVGWGREDVEPEYIVEVKRRSEHAQRERERTHLAAAMPWSATSAGAGVGVSTGAGFDPTPPSAELDEDWEAWLRQLLGTSA